MNKLKLILIYSFLLYSATISAQFTKFKIRIDDVIILTSDNIKDDYYLTKKINYKGEEEFYFHKGIEYEFALVFTKKQHYNNIEEIEHIKKHNNQNYCYKKINFNEFDEAIRQFMRKNLTPPYTPLWESIIENNCMEYFEFTHLYIEHNDKSISKVNKFGVTFIFYD